MAHWLWVCAAAVIYATPVADVSADQFSGMATPAPSLARRHPYLLDPAKVFDDGPSPLTGHPVVAKHLAPLNALLLQAKSEQAVGLSPAVRARMKNVASLQQKAEVTHHDRESLGKSQQRYCWNNGCICWWACWWGHRCSVSKCNKPTPSPAAAPAPAPKPVPKPPPPIPNIVPKFTALQSTITSNFASNNAKHNAMDAKVRPKLTAPSKSGEMILPSVKAILGGQAVPVQIMMGAEPSPFDIPSKLSAWAAAEQVKLADMKKVKTETLSEDVSVARVFLSKYKNYLGDLTRVGVVSRQNSKDSAVAAKDEAEGVRFGDHNDMKADEVDIANLMQGVENDLLLKKEQASLRQNGLFERTRSVMLAKAEQEKIGAGVVKDAATTATGQVAANEKALADYKRTTEAFMNGVKSLIAGLDVTSASNSEMGALTRLIASKDAEVMQSSKDAESELKNMLTTKVLNWAQGKYSDISSAATGLSLLYPTEWQDVVTLPVKSTVESASEINTKTEETMAAALSETIAEARKVAETVHNEALRVTSQFENAQTTPFRASDIAPEKFNDLFAGIPVADPKKAEKLSGWTISDLPAQISVVQNAAAETQELSDELLAEMSKHASERLTAVKAQLATSTVDVEADVSEAEFNATSVANASAKSQAKATTLQKKVEHSESLAKAYKLKVNVAAEAAQSHMESALNDAKETIAGDLASFNADSAEAVSNARLAIDASVNSLKEPIETQLLTTVEKLRGDLSNKSASWNTDLGWLETALTEVEANVQKYIGGHKELNTLESKGKFEIDQAKYNLERNKEQRNKTKTRLDEDMARAKSTTMTWAKDSMSATTSTIRKKLNERNTELYDAIVKVGRHLQGINGAFNTNQQELLEKMTNTKKKVATLEEVTEKAEDELQLDKSDLRTNVQTIKAAVKELTDAHKQTVSKAQESMDASLAASKGHNALVFNDAENFMDSKLATASKESETALGDANSAITETFDESTAALNEKINSAQQSAEDMTFKAKTVGQTLSSTNDEINEEAQTLIGNDEAAIGVEEAAVAKSAQTSQFMQTQLTTSAANRLESNERALGREKAVLDEQELQATATLAEYLTAMGMEEQEALDAAAKMVQKAAVQVHDDEETAAKTVENVTEQFEATEEAVAHELAGVDKQENETGIALGVDANMVEQTSEKATMKDREILAGTETEIAAMEQNMDKAGKNLLESVDEKARELEEENAKSFETVEEAIQAGEETLAEGRTALKAAGKELRQKGADLVDSLNGYKANVSSEITSLDALNDRENSTLYKNVRVLKAFMKQTLAIEHEMMDKERKRIDDERASADRMFDSTELEISGFSQDVGKLMNSDAFQALQKIMQADEDVGIVTRENEGFVKWMEEHEETSIPWMKNVLKGLSEAHEEKLKEDWKKEVMEKALALKEAKQTGNSFKNVEKMVSGADAEASTDEFSNMRNSSGNLLGDMQKQGDAADAAELKTLTDEMQGSAAEGGGELSTADNELADTRAQVIGANAGVTTVKGTLERIIKNNDKQAAYRTEVNEADLDKVMDGIVFTPAEGEEGSAETGSAETGAANATSFMEEGEASGGKVGAHDVAEWLQLLADTQHLSENYTQLSEHHADLGIEITHLREQNGRL